MSYKITGKVIAIFETQIISDRFSKRSFAIDDGDDRYPQTIKMECAGKNVLLLDDVNVGDEVEVSFNLRGREYTNRKTGEQDYFTSVDAWRVDVKSKAPAKGGDDEGVPF